MRQPILTIRLQPRTTVQQALEAVFPSPYHRARAVLLAQIKELRAAQDERVYNHARNAREARDL